MNKKFLFGMLAAAGMVLSTSCSNEEFEVEGSANDAQVSFNIGLQGGMGSRAISDGTGAKKLVCAVYDANGAILSQVKVNGTAVDANGQYVDTNAFEQGLTDNVYVTLAKGQTYTVAFWAQNPDCGAYTTTNLENVTVDYTGVNNDEARDAFFAAETFQVTEDAEINVTLKRPFAQINVGVTAEDWEAAIVSGVKILNSSVVIDNAATTMNVLTGTVTGSEAVTYEFAAIPAEKLAVDTDADGEKEEFYWLSMSYIIADDANTGYDKTTVDGLKFTFNPEAGQDIVFDKGLTNVPVQRNWRTNILGQILTGNMTFNITIDPIYEDDENIVSGSLEQKLLFAAEYGGEVTLSDNITLTEPLNVVADMILNLNGKTITGPSEAKDENGNKIHVIVNNANLTINGGTVKSVADNGGSAIYNYGVLKLDNVTIEGASTNTASGYASYAVNTVGAESELVVVNSSISGRGAIGAADGAKVVVESGTFESPEPAWGHCIYADGEGTEVVLNGGDYSEGFDSAPNDYTYMILAGNGAKVTVNGGNFTSWDSAAAKDYCELNNNGTIEFYGGTFGSDPSEWVADGYKVIENGTTYYVVSNEVDAVATSTEEFQAALDAAKEGTTIYLASNVEYGVVYMGRPTKYNSTTMYCENDDYTTTSADEFKAHVNNGKWHSTPRYTTALKDLTIVGAEGASVAGLITTSGHIYVSGSSPVTDYVLDITKTSGSVYYLTLHLENIKFQNVNFTGQVNINTSDETSTYSGISFEECTFTTGGTESTNGAALRYYNEANDDRIKNIEVNKCTFTNAYQGVYVHHVNGITVKGSNFDTTGHNAIAIQNTDDKGEVNLKQVVISGNTFNKINDRIIRFNTVGADSQIAIKNNTATNSGNDSGEVMKASSLATGITYNISGNNWGDNATVYNEELKDKKDE